MRRHILCIAWRDGAGWDPSAFEESRYDALGRRVWTRVRSPVDQCPGYVNDCADHTTRTIWDGDQVLWEIRTNGSTEDDNAYGNNAGRVGYTHGGLDAPLSMYRINYTNGSAHTLIVHMNWRGLPDDATFPGSMTDTISGALHISSIPFPAKSYDAYFRKPIDTAPTQWFGSIISGSRDASGQFYRRNRFYDANTGQFTQEDPAGLAGGLNAYGFAGGDPVTYGDPFGLCPGIPGTSVFTISDCPPGWFERWGHLFGEIIGYDLGANIGGEGGAAVGVLCGPAAEVCSPAGAVGGSQIVGATGAAVFGTLGGLAGRVADDHVQRMARAGRGGGNSAENRGSNYYIEKYKLNAEGRQAFHRELGRIKAAGDPTDDETMDAVANELAEQSKYVREK